MKSIARRCTEHFTTFFFLFPINLPNVRLSYEFRSDFRPSLSLFDQEKSIIICRVCMYWMYCVYGVPVWYVWKECIVICGSEYVIRMGWMCCIYGENVCEMRVSVLRIWSECVMYMEWMYCIYRVSVLVSGVNVCGVNISYDISHCINCVQNYQSSQEIGAKHIL